jgi:3-oxochol-4-en-24-oyl-CoA dehydrogenase
VPIALTEEHQELAAVVRGFAEREGLLRSAREYLDTVEDKVPPFWEEMASAGWLGLHLPEAVGGSGFGLVEVAVVLEELARWVAPGPYLPTVIASSIIADAAPSEVAERWLPGLTVGEHVGAIGFGNLALGANVADVFLLARDDDLVIASRNEVTVSPKPSLDQTRQVARVELADGAGVVIIGGSKRGLAIARALAAAEAAGVAHACTDMAAGYAKVREQFGRVIGSFMAVKHHCANMKVQAELATAAAWDGAQGIAAGGSEAEYAAAVAAAVALPAALFCSEMNVQVHGGIGFTWEHDAHLYMRRAGSLSALFGPARNANEDVFAHAAAKVRRTNTVELPPEAEHYRTEVRTFLEGFDQLSPEDQRRKLVDEGYLNPHWPKPWGRAAGPVEQLAIEEEMAAIRRPDMGIGGWVTLTFTQYGTPDQVARWTRPSMLGETNWCQLFSEPNAGSDAAGIRTKGTKVEGGWLVNGQKLWTSGAQFATHGFATVRTNPEAPKHAGITMMAIDLHATGVTIRPLRSIAGQEGFNEIFFDDVFVPDDDVIGPIDGGWQVARATLGNERVSIGSGRLNFGMSSDDRLLTTALDRHPADVGVAREVGALLAEGISMKLINTRVVLRAVIGAEPSPEGNVTKLLNSEHAQRVGALDLALSGENGALSGGDEGMAGAAWIFLRGLSIAGGTSEIGRNQIGERLLGLPREPGLR